MKYFLSICLILLRRVYTSAQTNYGDSLKKVLSQNNEETISRALRTW